MFTITCPTTETPVLIWTSSITQLTNTSRGIAVDFTCACDMPARIMSGRASATPWLVCHDTEAAPHGTPRLVGAGMAGEGP